MTAQSLMPPMTETREVVRFTMKDADTYAALTDGIAPEWQREFIRYMWYAKIPSAIIETDYLKTNRRTTNDLLLGRSVELESDQLKAVQFLTYAAQRMIETGLLPCKDTRCIRAIVHLGTQTAARELMNKTGDA